MLACSTMPDLNTLDYPMYSSIKLDGIRCLAIEGVAYSRNMKPIPNKFIQAYFAQHKLHGLDGELMIDGDFNSVQSAVMSVEGTPDFTYQVFDIFTVPNRFFSSRLDMLELILVTYTSATRIEQVKQELIYEADNLLEHYNKCVSEGYEGVIVRHPDGKYKFGRSTLKQQWMLKVKPSLDAEAKVLDVLPLLRNLDTSSNKKENMVAVPMLGSLQVEAFGVVFSIGSGFDDAQRTEYWRNREDLIGKFVTFKYQELSAYGVPRFPVFKGFRNPGDMS